MLNPKQQSYICERINSSEQDFFFWSGLHGEPFLEKDLLHYFDGEKLTIIGFPLTYDMKSREVLKKLNELTFNWIRKRSVKLIYYIGPYLWNPLTLIDDKFYQCFSFAPDEYNVDMSIDLKSADVLNTRNAKESYRKSVKNNVIISQNKCLYLSYKHINLIRDLCKSKNLWLSDVLYFTNILTIIKSDYTVIFEAHVRNELSGFAIVHQFFKDKPMLVFICSNKKYPGTSDALYYKIIRFYRENQSEEISIGYSVNKDLYMYKIKWGGVRCNLPFYQSIHAKKGVRFSSDQCFHWTYQLICSNCQKANPTQK